MTKKENSSEKTGNKFGVIRFTIYTVVVIANVLVSLCTLIGKASCFINPSDFITPSYLGLVFPYLLLLHLGFLLFWAFKKKIYILISIITLIFCYSETRRTFSIGHDHRAEGDTLSVLSYNVQMFQYFAPAEKNKTLNYVVNCGFDIVCLQEFGFCNARWHLTEDDLNKEFQKKYKYIHYEETELDWNAHTGEAILSKYPIINKGVVDYQSEHNGAIYADILFKGDTIRVFSCHLESNKLTEEEKKALNDMKKAKVSKKEANNVVNSVSNKMSHSYKMRAEQAEEVGECVKSTHYPVILCGDFNDVPVSYTYHSVKGKKLIDSFRECGFGYGYTYNKKLFHFRIDQIMHSKEGKAIQFEVGKVNYSDHYPISCKIVF